MKSPVAAALLLATTLASAPAAALELAALPQHTLDADQVTAAIVAAEADPLRFAVAQPLALGLNDGHWDEPAAGLARWRLRLASPGALSLSLRLEDLELPPDASLRLIGERGTDVQGPYGSGQAGTLWLPLVRSDAAVLEVQLPAAARAALRLRIADAFHGFRGLAAGDSYTAKGQFGSSDSRCEIDLACPPGLSWRDDGRAVVLITRNGVARCSGTLVNNARQDNRALVLTANHCGFETSSPASVRAYFNVQRTICGSGSGRVDQNLSAARFLARDRESDFALLELSATPPASFAAYYAGWDVRSIAPTSGAGIHHPQGDDKKISLYDQPATRVDDQPIQVSTVSSFRVDAWRVVWAQGTTEAGSSGSGLLNPSHRLVGVLSGGGASCDTPAEPDFFGRLDQAWTAQAETGGPLKNYLDPDCSGTTTLDGRDAGSAGTPATPGSGCPPPSDGDSGGGGGGGGGALPAPLLLLLGLLRLRRRDWRSRR